MRVIVAGAGALGSCIAVELARAGASVTVADPAAPGDNASGVAAGMLAPAFESVFDHRPEHFEHLLRARDLWPAFAAAIGVEIERPGALAVSFDEARIEDWREALDRLGVNVTPLSRAEVAARHPDLAEGLSGLSAATDWRIDPRRALAALRAEGERLDVAFRPTALTAFTHGRAEFDDASIAQADALVIATGASVSLLGLAPELAGLTPIKGHILDFAGGRRDSQVVRFEGGYLCPTSNGVMVGATMEVGRKDNAIDPARADALLELARRYAPGLDPASATPRAGVRAATADGLPLVEPAEAEGVWLAVGARRNGWLLAPLVARSIADQVIRRPARTGSGS